MVDDEDIDSSFDGLEDQAELLAKGGEERGAEELRASFGIRISFVVHRYVKFALESRAIEHRAASCWR